MYFFILGIIFLVIIFFLNNLLIFFNIIFVINDFFLFGFFNKLGIFVRSINLFVFNFLVIVEVVVLLFIL